MWQTKYALVIPINLRLGFDFWPCSKGDFLTGGPLSVITCMLDRMTERRKDNIFTLSRKKRPTAIVFSTQSE